MGRHRLRETFRPTGSSGSSELRRAPSSAPPPKKGRRRLLLAGVPILIVEDAAVSGAFTGNALTVEGAAVRIALNEEEALGILSEFHPRLIVLDLVLSRRDGFSFAKRVRSHDDCRDTLIVAVTTIDASEAERVARTAGCDGYIGWPIETETFARSVANYLAKHARRSELASFPAKARSAEDGGDERGRPAGRLRRGSGKFPSLRDPASVKKANEEAE
jgi:PleD family two-component response regulator